MSDPPKHIDENEDEEEEEKERADLVGNPEHSQKTVTLAENNMAKEEMNAWRKRRSIAFQRQPMLFRRMSRGETKIPFSREDRPRRRYRFALIDDNDNNDENSFLLFQLVEID